MIQKNSKPKVLLIGACSDPTLREVADLICLPGREYEDQRILIEKAVSEKGPFDAFGVSLSPPASIIIGMVRTRRLKRVVGAIRTR